MGTFIIEHYGYDTLWWVSAVASVFVGIGFWITTKDRV
jgi:hypothetical protein